MRLPKLLIVTNVPSMLREFLLPFGQHFKDLGWRVDALVSNAASCETSNAVFDNVWDVNWSRSPFDPANFTAAPRRVREVVLAGGYDIVHVHSPIAAFVTRFALRNVKNGPVVVYTSHGFHFHRGGSRVKNLVFQGLERLAGPWTDRLVVMNREDEAAAKRLKLVPEAQLSYMPGIGVDMTKYDPARVTDTQLDALWDELELAGEDRLILMIAEFNPGKRHRDALHALKMLGQPNVVMAFAGVGPLETEIKALADDLGLAAQTRFLGYRYDIPVILRAATALLLPSEREGLPRSIMEAHCLGTPVVSTKIRGVEDLLAGDAGLMTAVGDVAATTEALRWVLEHPDKARAMSARGQAYMQTFDISEVIRLHEELYASALGRPLSALEPELA